MHVTMVRLLLGVGVKNLICLEKHYEVGVVLSGCGKVVGRFVMCCFTSPASLPCTGGGKVAAMGYLCCFFILAQTLAA